MSEQINIVLPEKIDSQLTEAKDSTGLTKSEIARRGILSEINKLEVDD
jgi:hypothetical protein